MPDSGTKLMISPQWHQLSGAETKVAEQPGLNFFLPVLNSTHSFSIALLPDTHS